MSSQHTPSPDAGWAGHASGAAGPDSLLALVAADPSSLSGAELVDAIVASEKALSLLAGLQMRFMAALAEPFAAGDPMRLAARIARKSCTAGDDDPDQVQLFVPEAATCLAAAEIAAALRVAPVTAGIRVREAASMTTDLAPTLHALEQGLVDRGKARVIAEHCHPLSPEHTDAVQSMVLSQADQLTTSELRELAGQAVIIVDPEGAQERHEAAAARRELTLRPQSDAMATLSAYLPADGAVKIFQISDLLAASTAGTPTDPRGVGARRIDALVDIADQLLTHGYLDVADYIDVPLPDHSAPGPGPGPVTSDQAATDTTAPDTTAPDTAAPFPDTPDPTVPDAESSSDPTPDRIATDHSPADDCIPECIAPDETAAVATPGHVAPVHPAPDGETSTVLGDAAFDDAFDGTKFADTDAHDTVPDDFACPTDRVGTAPKGQSLTTSTGRDANPTNRSRRALSRQGRRPHLSVVIALGTLGGHDQLPAILSGYGAIPAGLGRAIAKSAGTVTALFSDPASGMITEAGELTYRPSQQLRDRIAALVPTCQFPSCRQPTWRCDIDHREAFNHDDPERGGRTNSENTGPFCRRHHLLKHHTEWRIRVRPERFTLEWTSPTGHQYAKRARPALLPEPNRIPGLTVSTPGTALAERLDLITTTGSAQMSSSTTSNSPTSNSTTNNSTTNNSPTNNSTTSNSPMNRTPMHRSVVEEIVTMLLIRHHLNQRPIEYVHPARAWDTPDASGLDHPDIGQGDVSPDDEPPF